MAITRQMVVLRMEDIAPFAEARGLVRLTRDLVATAPDEEARRRRSEMHVAAVTVAAVVAEALRAADARDEVRRLRDAVIALSELRAASWEGLITDALPPPAFDQVMAASARCRHEVDLMETAARRRARERIDRAA